MTSTIAPTAPIIDIQRFSLHDGPGIRSLVFFKGCALRCPWCQNPESQHANPVVAFYAERCKESSSCDFLCEKVCPDEAISRQGFRIDYDRCGGCGRCVEACADDALRLIGKVHTPEELMERLVVDRAYYESSGGGVTFSGGEPTLYPDFMERMLDLCRLDSIHTNLETSGTFSFERWQSSLRKLDLIYFDLKILDREGHRRHLGGGFETIAHNAGRLVEAGFPVEFRLPLVPGYTDTETNLARVIERLGTLGQHSIHLLAYHDMGEAKIDIIAGKQPKLGIPRYSEEKLGDVARRFEECGIEILNRHGSRRGSARPPS